MDTNTGANAIDGVLRTQLDNLALACRILEVEGHGDRTLGHLAMRDSDRRGFWLKRAGIGLGEVFDWRDFVLLSLDGEQLAGDGRPHGEWPIHSEIYRRRPDVMATGHTHPFHASIFSSLNEPLRAVTNNASCFEGPPPRYTGTSELITDVAVAGEMADALGSAFAMFLRNHGVVFCGTSVEQLLVHGIRLEEACQEQLHIDASSRAWEWPDAAEHARKRASIARMNNVGPFWEYFCRKLARIEAMGHPALSRERIPVRGRAARS